MDTLPLTFLSVADSSFSAPRQTHRRSSFTPSELVKFYVRPYSDTNFIIRVHNLDEDEGENLNLTDSNGKPVILSQLIGDEYLKRNVLHLEEVTLSANQNRMDMLNSKYRWDKNYKPVIIDGGIYTH